MKRVNDRCLALLVRLQPCMLRPAPRRLSHLAAHAAITEPMRATATALGAAGAQLTASNARVSHTTEWTLSMGPDAPPGTPCHLSQPTTTPLAGLDSDVTHCTFEIVVPGTTFDFHEQIAQWVHVTSLTRSGVDINLSVDGDHGVAYSPWFLAGPQECTGDTLFQGAPPPLVQVGTSVPVEGIKLRVCITVDHPAVSPGTLVIALNAHHGMYPCSSWTNAVLRAIATQRGQAAWLSRLMFSFVDDDSVALAVSEATCRPFHVCSLAVPLIQLCGEADPKQDHAATSTGPPRRLLRERDAKTAATAMIHLTSDSGVPMTTDSATNTHTWMEPDDTDSGEHTVAHAAHSDTDDNHPQAVNDCGGDASDDNDVGETRSDAGNDDDTADALQHGMLLTLTWMAPTPQCQGVHPCLVHGCEQSERSLARLRSAMHRIQVRLAQTIREEHRLRMQWKREQRKVEEMSNWAPLTARSLATIITESHDGDFRAQAMELLRVAEQRHPQLNPQGFHAGNNDYDGHDDREHQRIARVIETLLMVSVGRGKSSRLQVAEEEQEQEDGE